MKKYIKPNLSIEKVNLSNVILESRIGDNLEAFESQDYPFQVFEN